MSLTCEQIRRFASKNGKVTAWVAKGKLTMLPGGQVDSVSAWEKDAERFEFNGKAYARGEFEALVQSDESKKPKRHIDPIQLAKSIGDMATGQVSRDNEAIREAKSLKQGRPRPSAVKRSQSLSKKKA